MAIASPNGKFVLPTIEYISLNDFDLYSIEPNPSMLVDRPVSCLIGANGLGKSTFLNTLTFGITGALPDPNRKYQSSPEYFSNFSDPNKIIDYFEGRISRNLQGNTSVTVKLSWPSKSITVTRALFSKQNILELTIEDKISGVSETLKHANFDTTDDKKNDLIERFKQEVVCLCKIKDFTQFVFIVHFIWVFDEGRHLLMWDDKALTNALYLAFGSDPEMAVITGKLRRDIDKADSLARNARYAARQIAQSIDELVAIISGDVETDVELESETIAKFDELNVSISNRENRLRLKEMKLRDIELKATDTWSNLSEAQIKYKKLFSARLGGTSLAAHHPNVRSSIIEDHCSICSSDGVSKEIEKRLSNHECPLCGNAFDQKEDTEYLNELRILDKRISAFRNNISELDNERHDLLAQVESATDSLKGARNALEAFEKEEPGFLKDVNSKGNSSHISDEINEREKQRFKLNKQADELYNKRDIFVKELRVYENRFDELYNAGSLKFVPRFRELAEQFIGKPIDVEFTKKKGKANTGFKLTLRMEDQIRDTEFTVSESQKFFIDIALRMALSEQMNSESATLIIDTPEGSLDIAYEATAGSMFSTFVKSNNFIIMTANLRSSHLVKRLAELQKSDGMRIVKMTDWTELTEVQKNEEHLFDKAYLEIEEQLK